MLQGILTACPVRGNPPAAVGQQELMHRDMNLLMVAEMSGASAEVLMPTSADTFPACQRNFVVPFRLSGLDTRCGIISLLMRFLVCFSAVIPFSFPFFCIRESFIYLKKLR